METNADRYIIAEDGFAVCLTPDRSGVSCWTANAYQATRMSEFEAVEHLRKVKHMLPAAKLVKCE